jgi:phage tail protein X
MINGLKNNGNILPSITRLNIPDIAIVSLSFPKIKLVKKMKL